LRPVKGVKRARIARHMKPAPAAPPLSRKGAPCATVVVLACDAAATIRRCLSSLANQVGVEPFEAVVVWSGDATTQRIVTEEFPSAVTVGRCEPLPTGAGRNLGIRHSSGEVVAFLAADCEVAQDWLARRLAAHREGYPCVGGAVVCPRTAGAVARAGHLLEYNAFPAGRPREVVRGQPLYNLSYRRELFDQFGLYEESLACGEDTAFNWQLARAGVPALFEPGIRLYHESDAGIADFLRHQAWHGAWFGLMCRSQETPGFAGPRLRRLRRMLVMYPLGRFVRLVRRTVAWSPEHRRDLILLAPLIFLGLAAATLGLMRGWGGRVPPYRKGRSAETGRAGAGIAIDSPVPVPPGLA
jgi:GT2 family glycosyltransferase